MTLSHKKPGPRVMHSSCSPIMADQLNKFTMAEIDEHFLQNQRSAA